jgi:signal transduction histidine kinase
MARHRTLITYLAVYFFAIGSAIRILDRFHAAPSRQQIISLLITFLFLLVVEPWLTRRSHWYTHLYLAVQTGIVIALAFYTPIVDYFAGLFLALALTAAHGFKQQTAFRWLTVFIVTVAVLLVNGLGWNVGAPLIFIYTAAIFSVGSFIIVVRQAERSRTEAEIARKKSQALLTELQTAHQQLQVYTEQAEELAVVEERNRLARNLHDSVTQTIFSMTLTADAARILIDRDPAQARIQLDKLQDLAKSALAEMRSLVFELRPTAVDTLGLVPALQHHITTLERQHGLIVTLNVSGQPALPQTQAHRLFRIVQEALNNVVKYAQVDSASVTLLFENGRTHLQIEDHGKGFELETVSKDKKHMGLAGMRERAEMMGGTCIIRSKPEEGTRVTVELTSTNGSEEDG